MHSTDWHEQYCATLTWRNISNRPSSPMSMMNNLNNRAWNNTLDISIGCYKDDRAERALYGVFMESDELSTNLCISFCRSMKYEFAGLQGGNKLVSSPCLNHCLLLFKPLLSPYLPFNHPFCLCHSVIYFILICEYSM